MGGGGGRLFRLGFLIIIIYSVQKSEKVPVLPPNLLLKA